MKEEIIGIFRKAGISVSSSDMEVPPDPKLGDMSCTIAFGVAKKENKNPTEVAAGIAARLKPSGAVSQIKVAGPYINFFFDRDTVAKRILVS